VENAKRRVAGLVFVLVSVINLAAAYVWMRTGDVHREQLHVVMKGGRPGLWTTVVIFGVLLVVGLRFLIVPEPSSPSARRSDLTAAERAGLAGWSRGLMVAYVGFFVLLAAGPFLVPGPRGQWTLALVTTVYVFSLLSVVFAKRCPNCGLRIAYAGRLFLPPRCPKCGIRFK